MKCGDASCQANYFNALFSCSSFASSSSPGTSRYATIKIDEIPAKMEKIQNIFAGLTGSEKTGFIDTSQPSLYSKAVLRLWTLIQRH